MALQRACGVSDVAPGNARKVLVGNTLVAVVRESDGSWHAIADMCSHADVSLSEGFVEGCYIECWGHGSQFHLETGQPKNLPAFEPVAVYALEVAGEDVLVDVDAPLNRPGANE